MVVTFFVNVARAAAAAEAERKGASPGARQVMPHMVPLPAGPVS